MGTLVGTSSTHTLNRRPAQTTDAEQHGQQAQSTTDNRHRAARTIETGKEGARQVLYPGLNPVDDSLLHKGDDPDAHYWRDLFAHYEYFIAALNLFCFSNCEIIAQLDIPFHSYIPQ